MRAVLQETPLAQLIRKGATLPEILNAFEEKLARLEAKRHFPAGFVIFTRRGVEQDMDSTRRLHSLLERLASHLEADTSA